MFSKLSVINNLFFGFKLPVIILDKDFSIVHKYNFNDKLLNIFNNSNLINDLKNIDFNPCTLQFKYDDITFTCISFFHYAKTPAYFIMGPYKLNNKNWNNNEYSNIQEINSHILTPMLKLYNHILNTNYCEGIEKKSYSPLINRSIEYIKENFSSSFTIDDICSLFNINKCYFCSLFKKETGYTFINYLNNYKIEKSKELLQDPSLSLLDISLAVGFNNQSYYSTIFKKFTNQTPLEYRSSFYNNIHLKKSDLF